MTGKSAIRIVLTSLAMTGSIGFVTPALAADEGPAGGTWQAYGDVRLVVADGEQSWIDGRFGKLRSSGKGDDWRAKPELGNISLVWHPQFNWAWSATVVGRVQGGERTDAGLSEAFLTYRPMRSKRLSVSARSGLMWPAVSLEHEGLDWHVRDSITPSAINSWIGEEVKTLAIEVNGAAEIHDHHLRATAAVFAANDTSGTLLTFRGWALHDRVALAFRRQPLPPLDPMTLEVQAPYTHPVIDIDPGFAKRPGFYGKIGWQPPIPLAVELFHYDNRADPEAVDSHLEWGWRTQFDNLSAKGQLGSVTLRGQAIRGRTRMGFEVGGRDWVDERFSSAFLLGTRSFGPITASIRAERFRTRNRGSMFDAEYNDHGWSAMAALRRDWRRFTAVVELLHVSSRREDREHANLQARQRQTQLQVQLRTSL